MIAPINLSSVISILFFILVSPSASASVKSSSKAPKSPKTVSSPSSSLSSPRDVHSKTIAFPSTLIHTNVSSSKARGQSVTLRKGNGVYNPSCKYGLEVFAGAWMMPSSRFTTATTRRLIDSIAIIEDHVFQTVMGGRYLDYPSCVDATRQVLMSRDYFDFFIEHSSSTLNMKESKDIDMLLLNRTSKKSKQLKDVGLSRERAKRSQKADLYFWNTTVAVIPFATVSGLGNEVYDVDRLMREAIFEMTFWSIYRYFPSIVVSVTTEYDFKALKKLNLPILQIFYKKDADPNFKPANVKFALQATHDAFAAKPEWRSKFKFVYFTEGDSVLHMRFQKTLYDLMSGVGERGGYVLVPHRMQVKLSTILDFCFQRLVTVLIFCLMLQTIPIPQNLPKDSQSIPAWKRKA